MIMYKVIYSLEQAHSSNEMKPKFSLCWAPEHHPLRYGCLTRLLSLTRLVCKHTLSRQAQSAVLVLLLYDLTRLTM